MRTRETERGLVSIHIEDIKLGTKSRNDIRVLVMVTDHEVVRKKPGAPLLGRVDSFMLKHVARGVRASLRVCQR